MFAHLWPGVPSDEVPITSVTNGVHGPTWVSPEMAAVFSSAVGPDWYLHGADDWQHVTEVDDSVLWDARSTAKTRMVGTIRQRMRHQVSLEGTVTSDYEWVDNALDPSLLTIGFARRMATYKRAAMLLSDPERLRALVSDPERPVQFVFAGKSHPADDQGKELIRQIVTFASEHDVRHRFVFVEDYDMAIARALVQGCDVWLNTPVRPMEASGTSGEKAVLNGGLHCSVLDGWWAECFHGTTHAGIATDPTSRTVPNGWAIPSAEGVENEERRQQIEAASLFDLIEGQIVPLYYDLDQETPPAGWIDRIRSSLATLGPFVGSHRMVRDYVEQLYRPAAARNSELSTDGFAAARTIAEFHSRVRSAWDGIHIDRVETDEHPTDLRSSRRVDATVHLGSLSDDDVSVQLVIGSVRQSGELVDTHVVGMAPTGRIDDTHVNYSADATLETAGRIGVTVRVVPRHDLMPDPVEFGLITWP